MLEGHPARARARGTVPLRVETELWVGGGTQYVPATAELQVVEPRLDRPPG